MQMWDHAPSRGSTPAEDDPHVHTRFAGRERTAATKTLLDAGFGMLNDTLVESLSHSPQDTHVQSPPLSPHGSSHLFLGSPHGSPPPPLTLALAKEIALLKDTVPGQGHTPCTTPRYPHRAPCLGAHC